jgi:hypothetical protein
MNQRNVSQDIPILISIIPNLLGGEGHIIPYHNSVTKAADILGWKHIAAVAPDPKITDLPPNWDTCLSSKNLEATTNPIFRIFKFKDIYDLGDTIAQFLQQVVPYSNYPIVFIERFIHVQLLALLIALYIIPRQNLSVWLLYRRDTHQDKTRWLYKLLNKAVKQILEPGKFHLLTDSEILSKSLSNYFNETVTVMPIPHTEVIDTEAIPKQSNEIVCWWAGAPRLEKGWDAMKSFVTSVSEEANKICVVAAENSQLLPVPGGVKVKLISNKLTQLEYVKWLATCDIVLLPYDATAYSERTSGIFTECIMAGKIPVVSEGTWMAKELYKYGIEELIINWEKPEIVANKILKISKSLTVKNKVMKIYENYHSFHNVETYSREMNKIFDNSYN